MLVGHYGSRTSNSVTGPTDFQPLLDSGLGLPHPENLVCSIALVISIRENRSISKHCTFFYRDNL